MDPSDGSEPGPDAGCAGETFFADSDGDGYGDATKGTIHCEATPGFVARGGDCNDASATVHPGQAEVCDLIDNDCDGQLDDADSGVNTAAGTTYFRDADADGFGSAATMVRACQKPAGYAESSTDCNDALATVNPSAREICDQVDNDCDGLTDIADSSVDLTTAHSYYRDADNDTFGAGTAMVACSAPVGYVATMGDCNDADNTSKPGGTEVCDGADNDCDGGIDGTVAAPNRCTALVGSYAGSYSHLAQEKLGTTVINSMSCTGSGSAGLVLSRKPGLQGTFSCIYNGGLGGFNQSQSMTLRATVGLTGIVTGTIEHTYDTFGPLRRTYSVTGTQTASGLTLNGTGSFFPHPMSAVAWQVTFSIAGSR
ncbi:MAG: putative metal-binding motif-containing protein [Deltaproteobacteria bacterium]|nr:putative metal-binding motif-containing protein [Deltaproteobacteria bacterium]